jgi:hypothetical protein
MTLVSNVRTNIEQIVSFVKDKTHLQRKSCQIGRMALRAATICGEIVSPRLLSYPLGQVDDPGCGSTRALVQAAISVFGHLWLHFPHFMIQKDAR